MYYPMRYLTAALMTMESGDALSHAIARTASSTEGRADVGEELDHATCCALVLGWPASSQSEVVREQVSILAGLGYIAPLTRLINRRAFSDEQMSAIMARSIHDGRPDPMARELFLAIAEHAREPLASTAKRAADSLDTELSGQYAANASGDSHAL